YPTHPNPSLRCQLQAARSVRARNPLRLRVNQPPWRGDIAGDLSSDDPVDEHADDVRRHEDWLPDRPPASLVPHRIECDDGHNTWAHGTARRRRRAAIDHRL